MLNLYIIIEKFKMKWGIFIIKISKKEAKFLQSLGFKYSNHLSPYEADLHHTFTKHKTYYCAEKKSVIKALNDFRKNKVIYKYFA